MHLQIMIMLGRENANCKLLTDKQFDPEQGITGRFLPITGIKCVTVTVGLITD